jgi:hypothetical protein
MIWGMRNLLITIGAMSIINSTTKKAIVGLDMGSSPDIFTAKVQKKTEIC